MTLGDFRKLTENTPDETKIFLEMEDVFEDGEVFYVPADAACSITGFITDGKKSWIRKIFFFESGGEDSAGR